MSYVIRARVRERGEDDFQPMFAGILYYFNDKSAGWYYTMRCADEFKNAGEARKFFNEHKNRLLNSKDFSVALDSIEICEVECKPVERINVL